MNSEDFNYISRIIYKQNSIVIYYKAPMMTIGEHSIINANNYALLEDNKLKKLLTSKTIMYQLIPYRCIKLLILDDTVSYIKKDNFLKIGYIYQNVCQYVISKDSIINDICINHILGPPADYIDLSEGSVDIIDDRTLIYSYIGYNSFSPNIKKTDFILKTANGRYDPLDVYVSSDIGDKVTFIFKQGILGIDGPKELSTIDKPKSYDIFEYRILGNRTVTFGELKTITLMPHEKIPYRSKLDDHNYIIYVSKEEPNRTYGYDQGPITISGWVEFRRVQDTSLNLYDYVELKNININKTLTMNIMPCSINFDKISVLDKVFIT